ncbi:MAG: winged helix-turn-helix transcriptional regulator [Nitriliruptorales bacterium]
MDAETCSVARAVEILGDHWTLLVLREVFNGVRRFDDIQEHLDVSRSVLSRRLNDLVESGVLKRRPYQEPGDRVRHEYRLTEMGRGLRPVLIALMNFGDRFLAGKAGPPMIVRHGCGAPVTAELLCANEHHVTDPRELRTEPGPGARPAIA